MNTVRRPCAGVQGGGGEERGKAHALQGLMLTQLRFSLSLSLSPSRQHSRQHPQRGGDPLPLPRVARRANHPLCALQASPGELGLLQPGTRPTHHPAHDRHDTTQEVPRTEPTLTIVRAAIHLARWQCKQLLSYLPVVNYNVFYYLMAFLREVLQHGDKNKLQADKLGTSPPPPHTRNTRASGRPLAS